MDPNDKPAVPNEKFFNKLRLFIYGNELFEFSFMSISLYH